MASRRMFAQQIIDSDRFLDMPHSTQLLYFHLGMQADDDGFLDNYNSVIRNVKCNMDDLRLLVAKGFLILFDSCVVVIRDWRINNQLRKDRYHRTKHLQEYKQLAVLPNGQYTVIDGGCQIGNQMATESSLVKSSIVLNNIESPIYPRVGKTDAPSNIPTIDEVKTFCDEQGIKIDVQRFYNYYASRGWLLDGAPVKDWQALVKCWNTREHDKPNNAPKSTTTDDDGNGGTVL